RAALIEFGAVLVEDGEAARPAFVIAFIGDDDAIIVEPLDGVGLALAAMLALGEAQAAVFGGVDAVEINTASAEIADDFAGFAIENDDVVVFLQRHRQFVAAVEIGIFRLGVIAGEIGNAGQFGDPHGAAIDAAIGYVKESNIA